MVEQLSDQEWRDVQGVIRTIFQANLGSPFPHRLRLAVSSQLEKRFRAAGLKAKVLGYS